MCDMNQVRYELQADSEHRVSFRAFNDDGAINCEVRLQVRVCDSERASAYVHKKARER